MKTKDFLGIEWEFDCMGCAISEGKMQAPGGFIRRTQHFCVHQDPLVPIEGFLVIASTRHIHSIAEMDDSEFNEFFWLIKDVHQGIKGVIQVEYLSMIQEESSSHFHLWFFPWTQTVIENYGKPSLSKIREIMKQHQTGSINDLKWKELEQSIAKIKAKIDLS